MRVGVHRQHGGQVDSLGVPHTTLSDTDNSTVTLRERGPCLTVPVIRAKVVNHAAVLLIFPYAEGRRLGPVTHEIPLVPTGATIGTMRM